MIEVKIDSTKGIRYTPCTVCNKQDCFTYPKNHNWEYMSVCEVNKGYEEHAKRNKKEAI